MAQQSESRWFILRFVSPASGKDHGQDTCSVHGELAVVETIRDHLGMGWILVSIEVQ